MHVRHLPNALSAARILLIPFFVWQLAQDHTVAAAVLLCVSGLTDLLDGFLARRFGWVSQLGKVLDPAADKLTQTAVCGALAVRLPAFLPLFLILLSKELVMLASSAFLIKKGAKLGGARWYGKVGTALFYATMILVLLVPAMPHPLVRLLLLLTVAGSILALASYIPEYWKLHKKIQHREAKDF